MSNEFIDFEEQITKRIIKCYLACKGEATARMIATHIEHTGYGLNKRFTPSGLGNKMKVWMNARSSWFNITSEKRGKTTWYKIEK